MATADLVILGVSHRTAPVAMRERLAVPPAELTERLQALAGLPGVSETTLISTCNRVEIYAAAADHVTAFASLRQHVMAQVGTAIAPEIETHLYRRHGRAAIHHLFRVASSLDSLVVGEPQILGQIKVAFESAVAAGTSGSVLNTCFPRAFRVARRIRRETGIAREPVSVSSIAVELARRVFAGFTGRQVLLLGAGKMSDLAARALAAQGAKVVVTNRTRARAEELAARLNAAVAPWEDLEGALVAADIVISSTGARTAILDRAAVERVSRRRRRKPIVLIDIAVPRDIEPAASEVEGVFLWDIDDLQKEAATHLDGRRHEAERAETMVEQELVRFLLNVRGQAVGPTIRALRTHFQEVARAHADKAKARIPGLDARAHQEIDRMAEALVNELLHRPQVVMKSAIGTGDGEADGDGEGGGDGNWLAGAAQRLFELPPPPGNPAAAPENDPAPEPQSSKEPGDAT